MDLVVQIMKWKKLEFIPVENKEGKLVGVVTKDHVLDYLSNRVDSGTPLTAEDIMESRPACIASSATLKDAFLIMQERKVNFLPVEKDGELIGVLSKKEFQWITKRLVAELDS